MSKRISDFKELSSPSKNAFLALIDSDSGGGSYNWENYRLKIIDYFYNRSEIDEKITNLLTKLEKIEDKTVPELQDNIEDTIAILSREISDLGTQKQDKIVDKADRVIISDANKTIIVSDISTSELNCLKGITQNIQTQLDENTLVGEIKWLAGSIPHGRYLICDGRAVSRTLYSELYQVVGTTWGEGDGETTFNLPNLIGRVAWGAESISSDSDEHYISAGLPNITGTFGGQEKADRVPTTGAFSYTGKQSGRIEYDGGTIEGYYVNFDASLCSSIYGKSSTVQPPAATLIPVIRY